MSDWLKKAAAFCQREWIKIMAVSFFLISAGLFLLEHSYKQGFLCINIAEYIAMGITFILLTYLTILYGRKIYLISKSQNKD